MGGDEDEDARDGASGGDDASDSRESADDREKSVGEDGCGGFVSRFRRGMWTRRGARNAGGGSRVLD
jgi:hypothetical protein